MQQHAIPRLCAAALLFAAPGLMAASTTKVALVPGAPHPYTASWPQAGRDAVRDFQLAKADYREPARPDVGEQNALLESLAAQGYNAFLIFAYDSLGNAKTLRELVAGGAPVVAAAGCFKDPSPAQFCLATDAGKSAYQGARELIRLLGGKKRIAHFTGWLSDSNTRLRMEAVQRAVQESGAELVQVLTDMDAPEPAAEKIGAYLSAHSKDIDGIITTAWMPAVETANQLRRLGDKRIKMVGIDHDSVVLKAIQDGYVSGTMLQNPYGQAYIGAYSLDRLRQGCKPKANAPWQSNTQTNRFIDSGSVYVDASKVDNYVAAMQSVTKALLRNFDSTYLDCPK